MEKEDVKKLIYKKECTVVVDVGDNRKMAAGDLIQFLSEQVGDVIHACVPKGPGRHEVTVDDVVQARIISNNDSLEVNGMKMKTKLLHSDSVVVSFLHLPTYISDDEIEERLKSTNIELITPIYRRFYKGTHNAYGTRYACVKFPPDVKSLPYSMTFDTVEGVEFFRVLHDSQSIVCCNCMSDSQAIRDCPNITCYFCKEMGHVVRHCKKTFLCQKCGNSFDGCVCSMNEYDSEHVDDSDSDSTGDDGMQEETQASHEQVKVSKPMRGNQAEGRNAHHDATQSS
ncbi:uncharacterized protein LOC121371148 isoform X2 [Gigantopelta aegis]|uniref:uncharacterized protein LOC121371148 isoform X2 n=1 Tax=Gigantopelta aegis TaxID=1735272 RepID=UPI001B88B4BE|nr:uncharacterized protein LOC121371148 isoform X2 [Gigantopelta aegis]